MQASVKPNEVDVAIVGGGASGLVTAIFTARDLPDRTVVVLDGAKKLGAKILVAGGGRCNVTNCVVSAADYCGSSRHLIKRVLAAFGVERTIDFFRDIGVDMHEEEHGKLFPDTNRARTVLDALLNEAQRSGVRLLTEHRVSRIERVDGGFCIVHGATSTHARRVVLAAGGQSLPKSGSDGGGFRLAEGLGHSIVPPTPGLAPLVLAGDFHVPLSGIAQDVELAVQAAGAKPVRVRGALLWTHFGVSGPAVLDASRYWHRAMLEGREVGVSVNFLPGHGFEAAERKLLDLASSRPKVQLSNAISGVLPARVGNAMLHQLGINASPSMANLAKPVRRKIAHALVSWPLPVVDSRGYTYAEVTAGGVPLGEVDTATMGSRKCPGFFLVGEVLDVDGRIGGFNFQWAWSSGYVAAEGIRRQSGSADLA